MSSKRTSARLRSAARKRMEETGEKYTEALRIVTSEDRGTKPGAPGHGFTRQEIETMEMLYPNETDEEIHARLVDQAEGFPSAIGDGGETLHLDTSEPSPHQVVAGLAGTGALKSSEYDAIFGRVSSMNLSAHSDELSAETKEYTDQMLPFITLNTGTNRREATRQAIRDYGVPTLVICERFDDYEDPLAICVHPDDLTAEIIESPLVGYYVIDNVNRAVEDLNGMALITNLVATARLKGRAIRLLQESESMVPAAIAGAVTKRIKSEESYGLIEAKTLISLGSEVYGNVFSDETGIDFTQGSHLLVTGSAGAGKTVLLNKLANQMSMRGFEVNYCAQWEDYPLHTNVRRALFLDADLSGWDEMIGHVFQTMIDRQSALDERGLHIWSKADMKPVFLFIDSATALDGENAKKVGGLLREARVTGIFVVLAQQRARVADISPVLKDGYQQFSHRIQMGESSFADLMWMFSGGFEYSGEMERGDGIYLDANGNIRHVHVPWAPHEIN